jgi:hypothetical protein
VGGVNKGIVRWAYGLGGVVSDAPLPHPFLSQDSLRSQFCYCMCEKQILLLVLVEILFQILHVCTQRPKLKYSADHFLKTHVLVGMIVSTSMGYLFPREIGQYTDKKFHIANHSGSQ